MVRRRIARGLILIVAAIVLAGGSTLAYPHIAGLVYYKPRLDRLFVSLHKDPILIAALREQNGALADKDEAWALAIDHAWNAERLQGGGPLQRDLMDEAGLEASEADRGREWWARQPRVSHRRQGTNGGGGLPFLQLLAVRQA